VSSAIYNGWDLPPDAREALERLLGRPISQDERISILTYKRDEAPPAEVKEAALSELWARIDEKLSAVPDVEMDEIVDEAMRSVRPGYRSIR